MIWSIKHIGRRDDHKLPIRALGAAAAGAAHSRLINIPRRTARLQIQSSAAQTAAAAAAAAGRRAGIKHSEQSGPPSASDICGTLESRTGAELLHLIPHPVADNSRTLYFLRLILVEVRATKPDLTRLGQPHQTISDRLDQTARPAQTPWLDMPAFSSAAAGRTRRKTTARIRAARRLFATAAPLLVPVSQCR